MDDVPLSEHLLYELELLMDYMNFHEDELRIHDERLYRAMERWIRLERSRAPVFHRPLKKNP